AAAGSAWPASKNAWRSWTARCASPIGAGAARRSPSRFPWRTWTMRANVLLADDHQIVRQGVRALLERERIDVVAEASDGREAVRLAETTRPDVAVLDLSMPTLNGIDARREILKVSPPPRS